MDAEGFKVKVAELENPKDLTLTELVIHIVVNERLITTYKTLNDLLESITNKKREYTAEQTCFLESTTERLKLLYVELIQRAERYRDY